MVLAVALLTARQRVGVGDLARDFAYPLARSERVTRGHQDLAAAVLLRHVEPAHVGAGVRDLRLGHLDARERGIELRLSCRRRACACAQREQAGAQDPYPCSVRRHGLRYNSLPRCQRKPLPRSAGAIPRFR